MKMFTFFIIVFFLDFAIGSLLNIYYFKQESGFLYRTTYSIEKTTADLLIFGSSQADHNYSPEIFEKRINMSYYNVGRDGSSTFYHYAILLAVLKRYSPKIIILNFDMDEFSKIQESYDRISFLLPYYKKHPEIRSIFEFKSPFEKLEQLSYIYPYNSLILDIRDGNKESNKKIHGDIKGYVPLTKKWNEPIRDSDFVNSELDTNKIKIYKSFIKDCINSKVELYIVCSPYFIKPDYASNSIILGQKIANQYNVKFFDFSKDSIIINNATLFQDIDHLNNKGAKVFSNLVVDKIIAEGYQKLIKKP